MIKKYKSLFSRFFIKFILGTIILSLFLSTIRSYIPQDIEKNIAIVNGEKISLKTLQENYLIEREKQKKILGKNFLYINKNKKFVVETYHYLLHQLINNVLLEQYTKKIKFETTDLEIKKIILNTAMFQEKNIFSEKKYLDYLSSISLTNNQYRNIIKRKINTQKIIKTIADTNFLLEKENQNIIKLLSQKRNIKKFTIDIFSMMYKQKVTNKEAYNYFIKHKNQFYAPEKFKINYIKLDSNNLKTTCDFKEIQTWYKNHISEYATIEKKRYSIIQTETKEAALLILSKLQNLEKFEKIAKKESIDPISAINGGDIGWINQNDTPEEIKKANLIKKGDISHIISFKNNFLIIKLNDILASKIKNISEVYNIIKENIENQKKLFLYNQLKNKIIFHLKKNPNQFHEIAKEINIKEKVTEWFDVKSIPNDLNISFIKKYILNKNLLPKEKLFNCYAKLITLKNNILFLINIKNHQNKKIKNFLEVKKDIINKLKYIKAKKQAQKNAEQIIEKLKNSNNDTLKKCNISFSNLETISRYDSSSLASIIFSLPHPEKNKYRYTIFQNNKKNLEIIALTDIFYQPFSKEEEKIIIKYLEKNNTEIIFNSILKDLYKKAKIIYEKIEYV